MPLSLPIILTECFFAGRRGYSEQLAVNQHLSNDLFGLHLPLRPGGGFRIARPKPDPRMGNRRGKRIGRIRALRIASGQKGSHHHRNLRFFGVTGSDHGFLDEIGGIFRDGKARERWHNERYAPRLPEL